MKDFWKATLFGAALAVAGIGFAQSSTSPQKGDEDRTSTSGSPSSTPPSSTDTNSTASTTGSATGSTDTYGSKSSSMSTAPDTYTGTVATLTAGQTLVLTTANGQTQTFDLSNSPALASSVAVGSKVRVKKSVDASGKTVVTVEPYR